MSKLLYNAGIYTMDKGYPYAENILIKDGKITAIDVDSRKSYDNCEKIDMEGKTILPGFNDNHMHLLSYGISLDMVDLREVKSIPELINEVKNYLETGKVKPGEWIFGRGWNQDKFPGKRLPTRRDLDKITTEHPVVLTRACGHMAVVNTEALKQCGIDSDTKITGGKIYRDRSGNPNGQLAENAIKLINKNKPELSVADIKNYIKLAAGKLRKLGLTTVQTDDLTATNIEWEKVLQAYYELADADELPLKINEQLKLFTVQDIEKLNRNNPVRRYSDFFELGPLKIIADGSVGAGTAALREPYKDEPEDYGELVFTRKQLTKLIDCAYRNSMQVACHAIGDRIIELYLDIIAGIQEKYGRNFRDRIIHCQLTDYDLIKRIGRLGVLADVQPSFTATDWKITQDRLGFKRTVNTYAWKTLMEEGINVSGGSDCPVESPAPLEGIRCAVTRLDWNDQPEGGWFPAEKLTVYEALRMYTYNSAYTCFSEQEKGLIKEGYAADLVILAEDPFMVKPELLHKIPVYSTVVNGEMDI